MSAPPDSDAVRRIRLRRILDDNYLPVVVLCLVVVAAGGWVTYTTHLDPGVQTEERTVSTWSRTAEFEHGATVTRANPVYETGERLSNQRAYFPLISEQLSGEYQFTYSASESGTLRVAVRIDLLVQNRDGETVYWRTSRGLAETATDGVEPGETVATAFEFDLNETRQDLERTEEVFGDSPGTSEVLVQAETRLTGTVNGRTINRRFVDELGFQPDGAAFAVRDPGTVTNSSARTRQVQVQREYSALQRVGGPLAALVGVAGVVALVTARRRDVLAPSSAELDLVERAEYDEWISAGRFPASFDPAGEDTVELPALVDLVDVAADTNGRVFYDADTGWYVVPTETYTYACRPPLRPTQAAETHASDSRERAGPPSRAEDDGDGESDDDAAADNDGGAESN